MHKFKSSQDEKGHHGLESALDLQSRSSECITLNSSATVKHKKIKIEFNGLSSRLKNFLNHRNSYRPTQSQSNANDESSQNSFNSQDMNIVFNEQTPVRSKVKLAGFSTDLRMNSPPNSSKEHQNYLLSRYEHSEAKTRADSIHQLSKSIAKSKE